MGNRLSAFHWLSEVVLHRTWNLSSLLRDLVRHALAVLSLMHLQQLDSITIGPYINKPEIILSIPWPTRCFVGNRGLADIVRSAVQNSSSQAAENRTADCRVILILSLGRAALNALKPRL